MLSRAARSKPVAMRRVGEDAIRIADRSLWLLSCQTAGAQSNHSAFFGPIWRSQSCSQIYGVLSSLRAVTATGHSSDFDSFVISQRGRTVCFSLRPEMSIENVLAQIDAEIANLERAKVILTGAGLAATKRRPGDHQCPLRIRLRQRYPRRSENSLQKAAPESLKRRGGAGSLRRRPQRTRPESLARPSRAFRRRSVEIMRPDFQGTVRQSTQARRLYMNHIVLVLERALDEKELAACHYQPVTFIEVRCDDHVCNSRLIFHGDEDEAFGSARSLPRNNATGCTYKFAILASSQFLCRENVISAEFCAAIMHRVFADC